MIGELAQNAGLSAVLADDSLASVERDDVSFCSRVEVAAAARNLQHACVTLFAPNRRAVAAAAAAAAFPPTPALAVPVVARSDFSPRFLFLAPPCRRRHLRRVSPRSPASCVCTMLVPRVFGGCRL